MASVLLLDHSPNHSEFLAAVADRLSAEGHPSWLAGVYPRERMYQRRVARRLIPEGLDEIERLAAAAPLPWLDAVREDAVLAEVFRSTLVAADAIRPVDRGALRRRFRRLAEWFRETIDRRGITIALAWNGMPLPARALAEAARDAGIRCLVAENGFFPKTMQIDPHGVNAASSMARLPAEFFDGIEVAEEEWQALVEEMRHPPRPTVARRDFLRDVPWWRWAAEASVWKLREHAPGRRERYPERLASGWFEGTRRRRRSALAATSPPPPAPDTDSSPDLAADAAPVPALPGRYVFVPLQVRTDTQILEFSPHLRDPSQLVPLVLEAARANDPALGVVVKEHPKDLFPSPDVERRMREAGVVWLRSGDLGAILHGAKAVVTINSTVGMEALAAGRPVVTLGVAFFNKAGIVHEATPATLEASLRAALAGEGCDAERIRRFLCFTRSRWLVRAGAKFLDEESIGNAARAILERGDPSWSLAAGATLR